MKKLFSVALVALFVSLSAFAQENANRDENGKIVGGPYVTNNSTWFIDVDGGVNSFIGYGQEGRHGIAADVNVGKWFTPTVGARFGISGVNDVVFNPATETAEGFNSDYWLAGVHADFLWSLTNQLGGYKESRIWDVTLYPTVGYFMAREKGTDATNHYFAGGLGLINSWRLCERVDLNLDLRTVGTRNCAFGSADTHKYGLIPTATVGLTIRFGKKGNTGFKRVSTVTAPLYASIASLEAANKALTDENATLKGREPEVKTVTVTETVVEKVNVPVKAGDLIITFDMGSTTLKAVENAKLEAFVSGLAKDAEIIVTGSADSATGTAARNKVLSEGRANVVASALKDRGFTNVTTFSALNAYSNAEASRAAVVTVK